MFSLFKKKILPSATNDLQSTILSLKGLDCTSCAVDLDLTLEELPGVTSAKTNYAKSELKISFNPTKISLKKIKSTITSLGYQVK